MLLSNAKSLSFSYKKPSIRQTQVIPGGNVSIATYDDKTTIKQAITTLPGVAFMIFNVPILVSAEGKVSFVGANAPHAIPARTIIKASKDGIESLGEDVNFQF